MPTEPNNTAAPADGVLNKELTAGLEKVASLVHEHIRSLPPDSKALALLRVLKNVSPEEWERYASEHGLTDWLVFPLDCEVGDSVRQLVSIQKRLLYESDHDALTGIGNRRYFVRHLETEVERALRSHTELTLVFLDIDGFKAVNDSFGHDCGDMVLKRLAKLLQSSVRHYDIAARIGGEEFVLLLPASSCWTGVMLATRLLETFSKETFECDGRFFTLTFSAGVASLAQLDESELSGDTLLKHADKAMYEAKRKGKNTVVLAESSNSARNQASLVHAQEKQFLFSGSGSE